MAGKPIPLAKLTEGKSIYSIKGLVATLNWLIDWASNFAVEKETGLDLDQSISDHPKIKLEKGSTGERTFVTEISYDSATHELTYKAVSGVLVGAHDEQEYTVFTATPAYTETE